MACWRDVMAADAELALHVRRCFAVRKHATPATRRRDRSPRISGPEVEFDGDSDLCPGVMPGWLKALDLRRDPRLAIHSPTVDAPPDDPTSWLGDARIAGVAIEVTDPLSADGAHRFRVEVAEVARTTVGGEHLVIRSWHPDRAVEMRERR